jgi:hypothetical protein
MGIKFKFVLPNELSQPQALFSVKTVMGTPPVLHNSRSKNKELCPVDSFQWKGHYYVGASDVFESPSSTHLDSTWITLFEDFSEVRQS